MHITTRDLFNTASNLYARVASRLSSSGYSPFPIFVNCILTYECNMDCPFCLANANERNSVNPTLPAKQWGKIFSQIPAWNILGFSGGEVFCRSDLHEILESACSEHRVALVTNGKALNTEAIHTLSGMGAKGIFSKGLVQIGISVNEPIEDETECEALIQQKMELFDSIARQRNQHGKSFPKLELKVLIRDDTAPYLAKFAKAVQNTSVDVVTFQMLSGQDFCFYLGIDSEDRKQLASLKNYHNRPPAVISFHRHDELEKSLEELQKLPPSIRNKVNFIPDIPLAEYANHYRGRFDLKRFHCKNPWVHMAIDPSGVAYQCLNPEGVDLKNHSFPEAWNASTMKCFRKKLKNGKLFPHCEGCCFLIER